MNEKMAPGDQPDFAGSVLAKYAQNGTDKFEALVDLLVSRGYVKIFIQPSIEVYDGQSAKIVTKVEKKFSGAKPEKLSGEAEDIRQKSSVNVTLSVMPEVQKDKETIQMYIDLDLSTPEKKIKTATKHTVLNKKYSVFPLGGMITPAGQGQPAKSILLMVKAAILDGPSDIIKMPPVAVEGVMRWYRVKRAVINFPEGEDLSTPEAAYAAAQRLYASRERHRWTRVSIERIAESLKDLDEDDNADIPPELREWLLNTIVLEVTISGNRAAVIAEAPSKLQGNIFSKRFDYREFTFENGKWLYAGQGGRFETLGEARKKFQLSAGNSLKPAGQAEGEETWGEAVDGVQTRVRLERQTWYEGETPKFRVDMRNKGKVELEFVSAARNWKVEFDGLWYESKGGYSGRSPRLPFGPGQEHKNIPAEEFPGWQCNGKPLEFKPGPHTVRIALIIHPAKRNTGPTVRVVSNPVKIEILAKRKSAVQVEKDKRPVAIETKFLIVPESFLKEIGIASSSLDPDEEGGGKPGSMRRLAGMLGQQGITEILLTGGQLDDLQVKFLLRATMVQKNSRLFTYPQIIVHNNEIGTLNTIFMPFTLDVKPTITTDDKDVMLKIDLEYPEILKREKKMYKEKYPYEIPVIEQLHTTYNVLVPNRGTFLLNRSTITSTVEDEDGNSVQVPMRLLILIKPTIKPEHDSKTDPAEAA